MPVQRPLSLSKVMLLFGSEDIHYMSENIFQIISGEFWPMATDHFQRLADNWHFKQNVIMTPIEIEMSHSVCCYSFTHILAPSSIELCSSN